MDNSFWINLASKDLKRSKEFYKSLGFELNEAHPNAEMVSVFVSKSRIVLNLFPEAVFKSFANHTVTNTNQSTEVLFSLGANSEKEVDLIAEKVTAAGGTVYGKPGYKDGWMYGCGFTDVDGHRWSVLFMDMSKLPQR